MRRGALIGIAVCAALACESKLHPSFDPSGGPFGDGRDSDLVIGSDQFATTCVTVSTASGTTATLNPEPAFSPRRIVLFLQASGDSADPAFPVAAAGRWELATVESVRSGSIELREPLANKYGSGIYHLALACPMLEYRSVTIPSGASLLALRGVVAFFVSSSLTLDGTISARGGGFQGGGSFPQGGCSGGNYVATLDTNFGVNGTTGKGTGIDGRAFLRAGAAPLFNGGGGGNCLHGGGGGGGNRGAGGRGGGGYRTGVTQPVAANAGGLGGLNHALFGFGGGGGAGHQTIADAQNGYGAPGGGLVLVFARTVTGIGGIDASGGNAVTDAATGVHAGGGGGGGAGGAIWVIAETYTATGTLDASGGRGGDVDVSGGADEMNGPGGGGGGGLIRLSLGSGSPETDVGGGVNGVNLGGLSGQENWLAEPGSDGLVETPPRP